MLEPFREEFVARGGRQDPKTFLCALQEPQSFKESGLAIVGAGEKKNKRKT
jgi:hypothetical protein